LSQYNFGTTVYGVGFGLNKGDWSFSVTADSRAYTTQNYYVQQQINSQTLLANAVYNFKPVVGKINFYLGGGYGFARVESSTTNAYHNYSSFTTVTVMQVQFGVKMPVSKNFEAFADIRDSIKYSTAGYPSFNIGGKYNF